jgi:hypothetical protein
MDFACQPYAVSKILHPYRTGASDHVFSVTATTAKFLGLNETDFRGRDDLTALTSASPATQWYWHISVVNADTTVTSETQFLAEIVYDVEFFNRIDTTVDSSLLELKTRLTEEKKLRLLSADKASLCLRATGFIKQTKLLVVPSEVQTTPPFDRSPGLPNQQPETQTAPTQQKCEHCPKLRRN